MASDWCWSISCFSRRPHKKGRRQEGLCWPSRKTPRSATLPKPRRRVVQPLLLPSSVCENLYQSRCATAGARLHVRIISQARKWSHGRAPRNHACGNARRWEKLYHQTLTNAFLKKNSSVIVNTLIFVLEVPVSVVPSFRVSDLVRYYVGI